MILLESWQWEDERNWEIKREINAHLKADWTWTRDVAVPAQHLSLSERMWVNNNPEECYAYELFWAIHQRPCLVLSLRVCARPWLLWQLPMRSEQLDTISYSRNKQWTTAYRNLCMWPVKKHGLMLRAWETQRPNKEGKSPAVAACDPSSFSSPSHL